MCNAVETILIPSEPLPLAPSAPAPHPKGSFKKTPNSEPGKQEWETQGRKQKQFNSAQASSSQDWAKKPRISVKADYSVDANYGFDPVFQQYMQKDRCNRCLQRNDQPLQGHYWPGGPAKYPHEPWGCPVDPAHLKTINPGYNPRTGEFALDTP